MDQTVFTVAEFCATHKISRSRLYKEWAEGTGPRVLRVGSKVLVTREAAADWRRAREMEPTKQNAAA